jgi:hypothetical protein
VGCREGEDAEALTPYEISIQPEAETELLEAYAYYEARSEGLGAEFRKLWSRART